MSRVWVARGVVEAPPDAVFDQVRREFPASSAVTLDVDADTRTISQTGGWWYRGVTRVDDHPRGSLVVFELHNVASAGRWMVPLIHAQYRLNGTWDATRTGDLRARLQRIGDRLHCATEYLGDAAG